MSSTDRIAELTRENVELIASLEHAAAQHRTFSESIADRFAGLVGSWTFIVIQSVLLATWVVLNVEMGHGWDPYPFVLLNLALSFQAAFATPIIMMSQNRQGRLADRRNHLDLQINLLAEQESTETLRLLRKLCEKLDVQVSGQTAEILEGATHPEEVVRQIDETVEAKAKATHSK